MHLSVIFQLETSIYLLSLLGGEESPHRCREKRVDPAGGKQITVSFPSISVVLRPLTVH